MNKTKRGKKIISILLLTMLLLAGCKAGGTQADREKTKDLVDKIQTNQPTPTDISYSLERYNLVKRAYWVNGQREKAMGLNSQIERPLGYIVLITDSGAILESFIVDGKLSSLNSYLTGNYYYTSANNERELADVDGSYGENDAGIFFFTTDGKYIEYTGTYLYSDIPFTVENPILNIKGGN